MGTRQRSGKPTLADVAEAAAVSKATVSKAFNGWDDIAEATRQRVYEAADSLGYVTARRRSPRQHTQIWVAFETLASIYSSIILEGLVAESLELEAQLVLGQYAGAGEGHVPRPASPAWIRQGLERGAKGFILVTTPVSSLHLRACREQAPLMVVDPTTPAPDEAMSVGATNWRGGVQGTEHLLALGHRDIAFIGAPPTSTPGSERLAGVRWATESAGVQLRPEWVIPGRFLTSDGLACLPLLTARERPTAVFAGSDAVALGVIEAARRAGLRVPEDLSVIGFDNSYAAESASPPLTSVEQPLLEMGRLAMRTTISAITGGQRVNAHIQLATTLVERSSTGPAPGRAPG